MSETERQSVKLTPEAYKKRIIEAFLEIIGEEGWSQATPFSVCAKTGADLFYVKRYFTTPDDLFAGFGQMLDDTVSPGLIASEESLKEKFFEIFMARFDLLQQHREGVLELLRHLKCDPALSLQILKDTERSVRWLLDVSGVPTTGIRGALRVKALTGVWLAALKTWKEDHSEDLSATMAALDKALSKAETCGAYLGKLFAV